MPIKIRHKRELVWKWEVGIKRSVDTGGFINVGDRAPEDEKILFSAEKCQEERIKNQNMRQFCDL